MSDNNSFTEQKALANTSRDNIALRESYSAIATSYVTVMLQDVAAHLERLTAKQESHYSPVEATRTRSPAKYLLTTLLAMIVLTSFTLFGFRQALLVRIILTVGMVLAILETLALAVQSHPYKANTAFDSPLVYVVLLASFVGIWETATIELALVLALSLFASLVACLADTVALRFGTRRVYPNLSLSRTLLGIVAGIVVPSLAVIAIRLWFNLPSTEFLPFCLVGLAATAGETFNLSFKHRHGYTNSCDALNESGTLSGDFSKLCNFIFGSERGMLDRLAPIVFGLTIFFFLTHIN